MKVNFEKERMRIEECLFLTKKKKYVFKRDKPSKDLVWKLFSLVGRSPYSVTRLGKRRALGFMVKAHAAGQGGLGGFQVERFSSDRPSCQR